MKRDLGVSIAAGIAAAILLVLQMLLLSWVVRGVLQRHQTVGDLKNLLALTAVVVGGRALLLAAREVAGRRAAIRAKRELRECLAEHLLRLGSTYTAGERTGELIATAIDGIEKLDPYISRYLPQTVLSIAVPLIIVLAIAPVDPLSAGLLLFTVPVIVLLMILIGTFTRDHVHRQWEALGRLSGAFLDIIQGLPTLLLLDRDAGERRRVQAVSERFRDRTLGVLKVAFLSGAVLELMTAAGIGLIATILGVRLLDGTIPLDRAFFVFLLTPEFYRPLRDLGTHRHAVIEGTAAADRIEQILLTPALPSASTVTVSPIEAAPSDCPQVPSQGSHSRNGHSLLPAGLHVAFDDVSYAYPDREQSALSHISLCLLPGSSTALIGRSGSGKTTLINLLLRSMDPTEGLIRANGVTLSSMPPAAWRELIALVPQRPYLFQGTVRENIRLARPEARPDEVEYAAELAGCLPFIADLAHGFDTAIGERGETLSAGQRQRLAIARALLKDAPLLILDEPTSALDPESEVHIRQSLALLRRNRTVLIVAHRRNTVQAADRVAVLDDGRLVESGAHQELLRGGGLYAALMHCSRREAVPV